MAILLVITMDYLAGDMLFTDRLLIESVMLGAVNLMASCPYWNVWKSYFTMG